MNHAQSLRRFLLISLALALGACGDDPTNDSPRADIGGADSADAVDARTDAGADAATDAAADAVTDAGPTEPPDFEAGPTRELAEWTSLLETTDFLVGVTDPDRGDGTYGDIEQGRFSFPAIGGGPHGVRWSEAELDADGNLQNGASAVQYIAARVTPAEGHAGIIVQSDRSYRAWLDLQRRSGDIYGGNGIRVGWPSEGGEHELVVQYEGRRGAARMQVWTTPDEVALNTADMTVPQLVSGTEDVQWLGVPVVVLSDVPLSPVRTRVVGSEVFEETTFVTGGVGPGATTNLAFELRPTGEWPSGETAEVTVRVEAPQLAAAYETTIALPLVEPGTTYRRTRLSAADHSVQYAGIVPPTGDEPTDGWGMVLSLHGASVQGLGQARAYAPKEWAFIVAPTNRRPFGFDWEVWGRLDALEALADAKEHFGHDPTRVHVTGHSMGGHGTWQLGTLFPTLFATVGPSAGWNSFYSYGGDSPPQGTLARSQASSFTSNYATTNLRERAVYVIHGDADDNVPVREARDWVALLEPVVDDLHYHEQPGAGHWWNVDPEPGADCVDWPELFEIMEDRRLNPTELEFSFLSPSTWVSPTHSFVTVEMVQTPMRDFALEASADGDTVTLTSDNVLRMSLDGDALLAAGIASVVVDGEAVDVVAGPFSLGPESAKRPGVAGPLNTAMHEPFCFVYEEAGPPAYEEMAAWLSSTWQAIGNGHACTVTFEALEPWIEADYNLVFLGVPPQLIDFDGPVEFSLGGRTLFMDEYTFDDAALWLAYPYAGRQAALLLASDGREDILFRFSPFQSRLVLPDFMALTDGGISAAGFFDEDWDIDPALADGL